MEALLTGVWFLIFWIVLGLGGLALYICNFERAKRAQREEDIKYPMMWLFGGAK